jgi:hypothetical protein
MSESMTNEKMDHSSLIRKLDLLGKFADDLARRIKSEKTKQFRIDS